MLSVADDKIVDFSEAKRPHQSKRQVKRKEQSADAMRDRFRSAREGLKPKLSSLKKKLNKRKSSKNRKK